MNESTINIDVPFDWCHICKRFSATTDRYYMDNGEASLQNLWTMRGMIMLKDI